MVDEATWSEVVQSSMTSALVGAQVAYAIGGGTGVGAGDRLVDERVHQGGGDQTIEGIRCGCDSPRNGRFCLGNTGERLDAGPC